MSRHLRFNGVLGLVCLSLSAHACAMTVIDPTNLAQNTLTAVRTLEMANNQLSQLQNETQMLLNQARHLATLDFNVAERLKSSITTSNQLLAQAQGLAYEVSRLDREFARLYPAEYARTMTGSEMARQAHERWGQGRDGIHTALRMQAQLSRSLEGDQAVLTDLLAQSQSAVGALQANQATNQLLALRAKQAIQAQQLAITQSRSIALDQARQIASEEQAREQRRRFMGSGTRYTPQPVRLFGP